MPAQSTRPPLPSGIREPRVRLNTLVNLRWLAVIGQTVTVVLAELWLGMNLPLGLCLLVIGATVVGNLVALAAYPPNHRLSGRDAFLFFLFDMLQLTVLLALTGGLHNPFALLFLAPVTISATVLRLRATAILGAIALTAIALLGGYHVPLRTDAGEVLALPAIHLAGIFAAITIGAVFVAGFAYRLSRETEEMSAALLATQTALAREQKLHDLGGVVAAAAHELGTPLATIKLVSAELIEELSDRPELREDADLIRQQADRCRDILRSMGRAGKTDTHVMRAPIESVVREAAEPHEGRGVAIHYDFAPGRGDGTPGPTIQRRPEIIHGLRNMIQNAVDFARERVWVDVRWTHEDIVIRVIDDGYGYPAEVLNRLGDPFLRRREARPGYDGMGLGLFIAKTLLERTGGHMNFANGTPPGRTARGSRSGAIAEVTWPREEIALSPSRRIPPNVPLF